MKKVIKQRKLAAESEEESTLLAKPEEEIQDVSVEPVKEKAASKTSEKS